MPMNSSPVIDIRCPDDEEHVLVITAAGGTVEFIEGEVVIDGCTEFNRQLQHAPYKAMPWGWLEINTKDMTIDLVILDRGLRRYDRYPIGPFAWETVTHEFIDAVFSANQRFRSWI